jgi:hypothetical protein
MTDETTDPTTDPGVDQTTLENAGDDDPRIAALQAVFDRVDSWQESADAETVRTELDAALAKSDLELDESVKARIVEHIVSDASHGDIRELLG